MFRQRQREMLPTLGVAILVETSAFECVQVGWFTLSIRIRCIYRSTRNHGNRIFTVWYSNSWSHSEYTVSFVLNGHFRSLEVYLVVLLDIVQKEIDKRKSVGLKSHTHHLAEKLASVLLEKNSESKWKPEQTISSNTFILSLLWLLFLS